MTSLPIRRVIEQVHAGNIRIPAFQRGFVWDADRVAYLMDSIYKGYPFGTAILWRTKTQLRSDRRLGPFELPDRDPDYPIDYVLDGQQRLTSVFGVFQTLLEAKEHEEWMDIYYNFSAGEDLQRSQFLALPPDEVDLSVHFPIKTFFTTVDYRNATERLDYKKQAQIDDVQAAFKEATIPFQTIETDDRAMVAIVFERVNRLGVKLDILQLLSAWTWSEEFDLQEQFQDLANELQPFGFDGLRYDPNLLLRCCSAVMSDDASPSGILDLNGADVRDRFGEIRNGLLGAIDFLQRNLYVEQFKNLPYPTLLVPLTAFFAHKEGQQPNYSGSQIKELLKWFWRACFTRRFSAGVLKKLNRDIRQAKALRDNGSLGLADFSCIVSAEFFSETRFTIGSVNTSTYILLLAQLQPRSFITGQPSTLREALLVYNRTEFHHCYPRKFLKSQGRSTQEINRLANFAFVTRADNRKLGGHAPSIYRAVMNKDRETEILTSAACPISLFSDDYDQFIVDRAKLLKQEADRLSIAGLDS